MVVPLFVASIFLFHLLTRHSTQASTDTPASFRLQENYRICPLPKCEICPSTDELRAPAVGFALETAHGNAVVRLHDGTFHNTALIEGAVSYTALMRRLATGPVNRTPDHLDSHWEKLQYLTSRARRLANKLAGRPATSETAILATMVSNLVNATQTWLGNEHAIVAAVLSSPDRLELTDEEVGDIFDYLKLRDLMDKPRSLYQLYATSAAYAGYGKGSCRTYTDAYTCEPEESELPVQRVLHLDLNSETLSGTLKTLRSPYDGSVDASFVDTDLGFRFEGVRRSMADEDDGTGERYWTAVSDRIRELVQSLRRVYMPHVTELLLTGPYATNKRFHDAIRVAFQDLNTDESVLASLGHGNGNLTHQEEEWQSILSFATARGAAEIAKRRQEGPVHCVQSNECRRRRESGHGTQDSILLVQQPDSRPPQSFLGQFFR